MGSDQQDDESYRWQDLAQQVRDRRHRFKLKQSDLEARGGPSAGTVRAIEQQARQNFSDRSFTELEQALQWPYGTCKKILKGEATDADIAALVWTNDQVRQAVEETSDDESAVQRLTEIALIGPSVARSEISRFHTSQSTMKSLARHLQAIGGGDTGGAVVVGEIANDPADDEDLVRTLDEDTTADVYRLAQELSVVLAKAVPSGPRLRAEHVLTDLLGEQAKLRAAQRLQNYYSSKHPSTSGPET